MEYIVGIGMDQIEIDRVLQACRKQHFLSRFFTKGEQELIAERTGRAATNFAGKEAVAKCFGTGFSKIQPDEVEILRKKTGQPYVLLHGNAKKTAEELNISHIHISLSDTKMTASAYAVAVGEIV